MKTALQQQLTALSQALQDANLWGDTVPDAKQLNSVEPFCVDTLAFEQWLQWIFIPKMRTLLTNPNFVGLPNRSDMHTMATHVFADYTEPTDTICHCIQQIDMCLNHLNPSI